MSDNQIYTNQINHGGYRGAPYQWVIVKRDDDRSSFVQVSRGARAPVYDCKRNRL